MTGPTPTPTPTPTYNQRLLRLYGILWEADIEPAPEPVPAPAPAPAAQVAPGPACITVNGIDLTEYLQHNSVELGITDDSPQGDFSKMIEVCRRMTRNMRPIRITGWWE